MRFVLPALLLCAATASAQTDADLRVLAEAALAASPKIDHPHRPGDPPNPPGIDFVQGVPGDDFELTALYRVAVATGENGGFDTFNAVDPSEPLPGTGFVFNTYAGFYRPGTDTSGDLYYLGDRRTAFYLDDGTGGTDDDFVRMMDFQADGSEVQAHGALSDYRLVPATDNDGTPGVALFYLAGAAPDLIGFAREVTPAQLASTLRFSDPADAPGAPALGAGVALDQIGGPAATLATAVAATDDGRSFVVGVTQEPLAGALGEGQLWAAGYDADGSRRWLRQFGSENQAEDLVWDVATDGAFVYATGRVRSDDPSPLAFKDAFTVKIDARTGAVVAQAFFDGPNVQFGGSIALDDGAPGEGFVYTSGIGFDPATGQEDKDPYLERRRRSDLGLVGRVAFGPGTNKEPWGGLAFTRLPSGEGRIYSAGWTMNGFSDPTERTGGDVWLAAFNEDLELLWVEQWGSREGHREWAWDLAVGPGGEVYVVGYTLGTMGAPGSFAGGGDGFVTRLDPEAPQGQRVVWTRHLGSASSDEARKVSVMNGEVYVAAHTYGALAGPNAGRSDAWVGRFSTGGALLGEAQVGTPGDDRVVLDARGGAVHVAGYTTGAMAGPSGGFVDAFVGRLGAGLGSGGSVATEGTPAPSLGLGVFPNPASASARVTLAVPEGGPVRVTVVDALGREVAVVHDGPLGPGPHALGVEAWRLAPGLYVVRATGAAGSQTRTLSIAR